MLLQHSQLSHLQLELEQQREMIQLHKRISDLHVDNFHMQTTLERDTSSYLLAHNMLDMRGILGNKDPLNRKIGSHCDLMQPVGIAANRADSISAETLATSARSCHPSPGSRASIHTSCSSPCSQVRPLSQGGHQATLGPAGVDFLWVGLAHELCGFGHRCIIGDPEDALLRPQQSQRLHMPTNSISCSSRNTAQYIFQPGAQSLAQRVSLDDDIYATPTQVASSGLVLP